MTYRDALLLVLASLLLLSCGPADHGPQQANASPAPNPAAEPEPPAHPSGMELQGMFRYMADAAVFRDCRTNKSFPVSMEGAYIDLERAYLNSGITAGEELYASLSGRYLERPAMEGNHNIVKLIVDKLNKIDPEKTCSPATQAELLNTYWKLTELEGQKVTTPENGKEAHLVLASTEARAHGNSGCNNFFGSFETRDDSLTFGPLASTMKACPGGMDTERAFLGTMGRTTRYEISGQILQLFAGDEVIARLEAVYL